MTDVLSLTELTVTFKPGHSPLGHHWELFDGSEQPVGRTRREYSGGLVKRQLWRSVTATGMDSGNDIHAQVLDAGGTEVFTLFSQNVNSRAGRRPSVTLSRPDGSAVGAAHHPEGDDVTFTGPDGTVVASLPIPDRKASPWKLLDAAGTPIGLVDREVAKPVAGPSLLDYAVGINTITDNASDFAATMFRGFLFSNTYSVALPELPADPTLRALAVLSPVLLGHLY